MTDEKKSAPKHDQPPKEPATQEPEVLDDGVDEEKKSVLGCCTSGGSPTR